MAGLGVVEAGGEVAVELERVVLEYKLVPLPRGTMKKIP